MIALDLMRKEFISLDQEETIGSLIGKIERNDECAAIIVSKGKYIGIINKMDFAKSRIDTQKTKRVKSFFNESKGIFYLFTYPKTLKEFWWSFLLALARLYMWIRVFWETKVKEKHYRDNWERVESTK